MVDNQIADSPNEICDIDRKIPSPAPTQCDCIRRDYLSPQIKKFGGDPAKLLPVLLRGGDGILKKQNPNGSWGDSSRDRSTSLALLAVMLNPRSGYVRRHPAMLRAISSLLVSQEAVDPEAKACKTWALCEAFGCLGNYSWEEPSLDLCRSLLKAQGGDGGFAPSAADPSEVKQTLVSIEAMSAAQTLWPHEPGLAEALRKGRTFVAKTVPEKEAVWGLHGYLRASQAFLSGGDAWAQWQRSGEAEILRTQQKDGLWEAAAGESQLETSVFAVLCLSLYFEGLPEARTEKKNVTPRWISQPEEEIKL